MRTVTLDEEKSRILVRDPRFGQNNISVFDAESGEMLWRHSLSEEAIKSMRVAEFAAGEQGVIDRVIRYDRVQVPIPFTMMFGVKTSSSAMSLNSGELSQYRALPFYVTTLGLADGRCIWRTRINPFDLLRSRSSNPEHHETEGHLKSKSRNHDIRRLDVTNGTSLQRGISAFEGGVGRADGSGGR